MEVPKKVQNRLRSQEIDKGSVEGELKFYAWDTVAVCSGTMCPAFADCTFPVKNTVAELYAEREKGNAVGVPPCKLMDNYLTSVTDIIFRNYAEDLNEAQLFRIGMGMLPMYRQLCKLQIEELGLRSVLYHNEKGDPRLHPLINAIRDQVNAIEKMWNSIGLNELDKLDTEKSANVYDAMNREALEGVIEKKKAREEAE